MKKLFFILCFLASTIYLGASSVSTSAADDSFRFEQSNVYVSSTSPLQGGGQCAMVSICGGPYVEMYDGTGRLRARSYYLLQYSTDGGVPANTCYTSYSVIKSAPRSSCN